MFLPMDKEIFAMDGKFARFMNFLWNLIFLSILSLASALPLVTLCPGSAAAYYVMAKSVRRHHGTAWGEFKSGFRKNFRQGWTVSLIFLGVLLVLLIDCVYFYGKEETLALLYLFYLLILLAVTVFQVFCACLSRFTDSRFRLFRISLGLIAANPIPSILLLLMTLAALMLIYLMPWGILVFPGLVIYLQTYLLEPMLRRASPEPEEGSEEAQKWYYE